MSRPPALASRCPGRVDSHKTVGVRRLSCLKRVPASTVRRQASLGRAAAAACGAARQRPGGGGAGGVA